MQNSFSDVQTLVSCSPPQRRQRTLTVSSLQSRWWCPILLQFLHHGASTLSLTVHLVQPIFNFALLIASFAACTGRKTDIIFVPCFICRVGLVRIWSGSTPNSVVIDFLISSISVSFSMCIITIPFVLWTSVTLSADLMFWIISSILFFAPGQFSFSWIFICPLVVLLTRLIWTPTSSGSMDSLRSLTTWE